VGAAAFGCSSDQGSAVGRVSSAIVGSEPSDAAQDSVVMLVFSDPAASQTGICTAALVAPRLVLTARHCVAETDADVSCSVDGQAFSGGGVRANHDARKLYVFTGKDRPDLDPAKWKPAGRGVEVLDDGSSNLCTHDLALVLLEQPITGVPLASIRLEGTAEQDERLTTVGWGISSSTNAPAVRQQRSGVHVTRIGPDEADPVLTPNEFGFDESICLGDSGGPVLSESSNAVVGVVSRGGNGKSAQSDSELVSTCTQATNLATKLAPFRDLVMRAFARAGAEPLLEAREADDGGGCSLAYARERSSWQGLAAGMTVLALVLVKRRGALRTNRH
jgi:hypothetical protein